ncbi:hypothetical protein [Jeongeupia chitinilytica]|uniref:Inovirus Gp2 family protein n=1 Tax=Jeongeupia chitinilytica TaxID=1041641 RepID=A0ABQ3GX38_9NEIS|nr:hypothetical protein [Jeongeupia chitinilytica]GHD56953.1 hypothetical protein GCM10007350_04910 [Jeongeupia chitinilytica]
MNARLTNPSKCGSAAPTRMAQRKQTAMLPLSTGGERSIYLPIMTAIDDVLSSARQEMARPAAAMVRVTLLRDDSMAKVMQLLCEHFTRRGASRPGYVWALELEPDDKRDDYPHYHLMVVFDLKANYIGTLVDALKRLKQRGWIEGFHISKDRGRLKIHALDSDVARDACREHAGYIAKVDTKRRQPGRRLYGRSQISKVLAAATTPEALAIPLQSTVHIEAGAMCQCTPSPWRFPHSTAPRCIALDGCRRRSGEQINAVRLNAGQYAAPCESGGVVGHSGAVLQSSVMPLAP